MKAKENFKHAAVGLIPKDWEVKKVSEVFDFNLKIQSTVNTASPPGNSQKDYNWQQSGLIHPYKRPHLYQRELYSSKPFVYSDLFCTNYYCLVSHTCNR